MRCLQRTTSKCRVRGIQNMEKVRRQENKKMMHGLNNDIGRAFGFGRWRGGGGKRAHRRSTWMMRGNGRQKRFPYCPPIALEFRAPQPRGPVAAAADRQRSPESRSFVFRAHKNHRYLSDGHRAEIVEFFANNQTNTVVAAILRTIDEDEVFRTFHQTRIILTSSKRSRQ